MTLDITRKNSLYWILNVEIHLDVMDIGIPLNKEIKASKQLICSCDQNIMNFFHAYVWLTGLSNKAFDEKS